MVSMAFPIESIKPPGKRYDLKPLTCGINKISAGNYAVLCSIHNAHVYKIGLRSCYKGKEINA